MLFILLLLLLMIAIAAIKMVTGELNLSVRIAGDQAEITLTLKAMHGGKNPVGTGAATVG